MSSLAARKRLSRMQNLADLQRWTIENIPSEMWDTEPAIEAMVNRCLAKWAKSSVTAKDYAMTVRARLLTGIRPVAVPAEGTPLPVDEEAKLSVSEIISGYRATVPPPPLAEHEVIDE